MVIQPITGHQMKRCMRLNQRTLLLTIPYCNSGHDLYIIFFIVLFADWNEKEQSKEDLQVWEDDWDDDGIEDDFSQQLR